MSDGPAELVFAVAAYPIEPLSRATKLRLIATVLAFVLLLTGFEVGVRAIPPDAIQVTASDAASGHTLASANVTDRRVMVDLHARINSLPTGTLDYNCSGGPIVDGVTFEVDFMRWGVLIEAATLPWFGCGFWKVSQGGIPSMRDDPNGQTQAILSEIRSLLPAVLSP